MITDSDILALLPTCAGNLIPIGTIHDPSSHTLVSTSHTSLSHCSGIDGSHLHGFEKSVSEAVVGEELTACLKERAVLKELLQQLHEHRTSLDELLSAEDVAHRGKISRSAFHVALTLAGVNMTQEELSLLETAFAVKEIKEGTEGTSNLGAAEGYVNYLSLIRHLDAAAVEMCALERDAPPGPRRMSNPKSLQVNVY
jgi:hypothetical protein